MIQEINGIGGAGDYGLAGYGFGDGPRLDGASAPGFGQMINSLIENGSAANCPQCQPGQMLGMDNNIYQLQPTGARIDCTGSYTSPTCTFAGYTYALVQVGINGDPSSKPGSTNGPLIAGVLPPGASGAAQSAAQAAANAARNGGWPQTTPPAVPRPVADPLQVPPGPKPDPWWARVFGLLDFSDIRLPFFDIGPLIMVNPCLTSAAVLPSCTSGVGSNP